MKSLLLKVYDKLKYEFPIFILLTIQLIPQDLDFAKDPYASILSLDYRIGFAPKIFMGSVLALFTDYRGHKQVNVFFTVIFILSFILLAWVAGRLIRSAGDDTKQIMIFLVALFLAGPYTTAFLFPQLFSPDRFLVIFTLLALLVLSKPKIKWLLPVILFMALATHQMFAFAYMPVIAVLLLYEMNNSNFSKKAVVFSAVNFLTMAFASAYFFLFTGLKNFSLNQLISYAETKTDIPIRKDMIEGYFFLNPFKFIKYTKAISFNMDSLNDEIRAVIFLIPLILIFFFIWKNAMKYSTNKFEKFIFILCFLVPLARIPLFVMTTEVYRGRIGMILVQFFLLFYFLYKGNSAVTESVKKISEFFSKNVFLAMLIVAYFALTFFQYNITQPWRDIFEKLTTLR
jgi:hypothetical protein